jgi:mRNA interferase RelE/StbE
MFDVLIEKKADKILRSFDPFLRRKMAEEVFSLSTKFMDGKRLSGTLENCRSYRVGDYRILYDVDFTQKKVRILHIGHRSEVYKS